MFQVVAMWNLSRPDEEMKDSVACIQLRGYNSASEEILLTGEFARKLRMKEIKPLSVSNIADKYCPTRRNLYLTKGINRAPRRAARGQTWGGIAGYVVEDYIKTIIRGNASHERSYSSLTKNGRRLSREFASSNKSQLEKLRNTERDLIGPEIGNTDWLLRLLDHNGRAELGLRLLHSIVTEEGSLDIVDVRTDQETLQIKPNTRQIGINSPATPDFIIPDSCIVGDVKSGRSFKDHFLLTCAGYALAYESQNGEDHDINWGVIYFIPTRSPSDYFKLLTSAQVYIFPIHDELRSWFLEERNEAYDVVSKPKPPAFPKKEEKEHCRHCRFEKYCIKKGLRL